jgi:hypothetical protein
MGTYLMFLVITALPLVVAVAPFVVHEIVRTRVPEPASDPFDTLHLQERLTALADEILRLESDPEVYARAFRIKATRTAYDDLLAEALLLAGVAPEDGVPPQGDGERGLCGRERTRLVAELELTARGWSW